MRISVVTISYNQAQFLPACLDSVLAQSHSEVEHIVIDAVSKDGSQEILERYRPKLAHVIIEKDRGPTDGLNKGFGVATGDILYYLNADDVVLPGAFSDVVRAYQESPASDVIYGDGKMLDEHGRTIRPIYSTPGLTAKTHALGAATIVQQATFFRRKMFDRVGGFNLNNHSCWDGELIHDFLKAGASFRYVKADWGGFRVYPGSISGSNRLGDIYKVDQARIFESAFGRPRAKADAMAQNLLRTAFKLQRLTMLKRSGRN